MVLCADVSMMQMRRSCCCDLVRMRTIASLRIHVERVIRGIRLFKALDINARFPLPMVDMLDDSMTVAWALGNMQERIVKI